MIAAYRIGKHKYAHDPLSGSGGVLVGGRWHHKGMRVVYCAQSLSLASLEFLVHFQPLEKAIQLVAFAIEIPESLIEELPSSALAPDWSAVPSTSATADIGTDWLKSARTPVLRVPSVLSPGEYNFLLNPVHSAAQHIKIVGRNRYHYDSRLWKEGTER